MITKGREQWRHKTWGSEIECGETSKRPVRLEAAQIVGVPCACLLWVKASDGNAEIRRRRVAGQLSQDVMREMVRKAGSRNVRNGSVSLELAFPCNRSGSRWESDLGLCVLLDHVGKHSSPKARAFESREVALWLARHFGNWLDDGSSCRRCRQRGAWCSDGGNLQRPDWRPPEGVCARGVRQTSN